METSSREGAKNNNRGGGVQTTKLGNGNERETTGRCQKQNKMGDKKSGGTKVLNKFFRIFSANNLTIEAPFYSKAASKLRLITKYCTLNYNTGMSQYIRWIGFIKISTGMSQYRRIGLNYITGMSQ